MNYGTVDWNDESAGPLEEPVQELEGSGLENRLCEKLYTAGYDTVDSVRQAEDDELDRIKGVGPTEIDKIRDSVDTYLKDNDLAEES